MSDQDGQGVSLETPVRGEHSEPLDNDPPARPQRRRPARNRVPDRTSVVSGPTVSGGLLILAGLVVLGAILVLRRRPAPPQSLLSDLRASPSRWWNAVADAERNLANDFRHRFNNR